MKNQKMMLATIKTQTPCGNVISLGTVRAFGPTNLARRCWEDASSIYRAGYKQDTLWVERPKEG